MRRQNESRTLAATTKEKLDELQSSGIDVKRKNDLNSKQELEEFARIIKQSMYEDYKLAYSNKGDKFKEEGRATVNIF